jgi:hypothetical protein
MLILKIFDGGWIEVRTKDGGVARMAFRNVMPDGSLELVLDDPCRTLQIERGERIARGTTSRDFFDRRQ